AMKDGIVFTGIHKGDRGVGQTRQPRPTLTLPLSSWYGELSVALSILHKVALDPSAATDWLLAVNSALTSGQRLSSSLTLVVTYLLITTTEDICLLALKASQAVAAADPCQVENLMDFDFFSKSVCFTVTINYKKSQYFFQNIYSGNVWDYMSRKGTNKQNSCAL
ncbi:hypothetical protein XENOCAPTIV_003392, partial [Xenoophorus captivus]